MGVRGPVGAAPEAGRGAVGAGCVVGALLGAAAGFAAGTAGRTAGTAFGGVASEVDGPDVRGATIGRAPPGIIGRGGKSMGRPTAGGAAGDAVGGAAGAGTCGLGAGAFSLTAAVAALVLGAGTTG